MYLEMMSFELEEGGKDFIYEAGFISWVTWAGSCQSRKWSDVLDSSVEAGLKTRTREAIAIFQMRGG